MDFDIISWSLVPMGKVLPDARSQAKKLREVASLQERQDRGETLEKNQVAKIARRDDVLQELFEHHRQTARKELKKRLRTATAPRPPDDTSTYANTEAAESPREEVRRCQ